MPPATNPDNGRPTRDELQKLTETVPAIVYIAEMGEHGRWYYVSSQIKDLLGYEPDEWIADPGLWYRSLHPDDIEAAMVGEDHNPVETEIFPSVEYRLRTRDGRFVWVYESARLVVDPDGGPPLWHGVISDVSALREAQESAARKAEQQALTARLGVAAIGVVDQQELIVIGVQTLLGLEDVVEAEVWEHLDGKRIRLCHRSSHDGPHAGPVPTLPFESDRYPGSRLEAGETVMIADWNTDQRMAPYAEYRNPAVASTMIVPIAGTQRQFGFLSVHASVPDRFSKQDEDFLLAAASLLASTIERNRNEQSLRHRLLHDSLTELPNRELFTERLALAIKKSGSTGCPIAALFLDIDHFKLINDGIGHYAGDETLREVGSRLSEGLSDGDTIARFGGDEFGIVVGSVKSADDALHVAESLLDRLTGPILVEGSDIVVTASIGVALFHPDAGLDKEPEFLIREANAAMHEAKNLGRAQVRLFDESLRSSALNRLQTESGLRAAIEHEELRLHYQPVISIPDYRIRGFEALVRWQHPERGLIRPDEFVPVAEKSGLISQIDSWVLEEAVRQTSEWQPDIPSVGPFTVSVNASARQLNRTRLPDEIASLLEHHSLPPELLTIEITEGTLISGPGSVRSVLDKIDDMGVRLALDDFGTGFSSLSYLSQFPLDLIKIDRSFIEQLGDGDPGGRAIAEAILRIGSALSMIVVAEGVSTRRELEMVEALGCRVAQGFLISPPVPPARATEILRGAVLPILGDWDGSGLNRRPAV